MPHRAAQRVEEDVGKEKCFACDRKLGKAPVLVTTTDGQRVFVGRECAKEVKAAGVAGYQPPKGGPKLRGI